MDTGYIVVVDRDSSFKRECNAWNEAIEAIKDWVHHSYVPSDLDSIESISGYVRYITNGKIDSLYEIDMKVKGNKVLSLTSCVVNVYLGPTSTTYADTW